MNARKLALAAAAATGLALLGGCADYPYYGYDDGYYNNGYYTNYGYNTYPNGYYSGVYGPGYYVAPSVSFGLAYNDRDEEHHWRHH